MRHHAFFKHKAVVSDFLLSYYGPPGETCGLGGGVSPLGDALSRSEQVLMFLQISTKALFVWERRPAATGGAVDCSWAIHS